MNPTQNQQPQNKLMIEDFQDENMNIMNQTISEAQFQLSFTPAAYKNQRYQEAFRKTQVRRRTILDGNHRTLKAGDRDEQFHKSGNISFNLNKSPLQAISNCFSNQSEQRDDVLNDYLRNKDHGLGQLISEDRKEIGLIKDFQLRQPKIRVVQFQTQSSKRVRDPIFSQLLIYFHLSSFIRRLYNSIKPGYYFLERHFRLIDDNGSGAIKEFLNQKPKKNLLQNSAPEISSKLRLQLLVRKLIRSMSAYIVSTYYSVPLITQDNTFKVVWDVTLTCIRLFLLFLIPIQVAFNYRQLFDILDPFMILFSILLFFDLILRYFTIFYEQGLPVQDRKLILHSQLRLSNLLELISILAQFLYSANNYDFVSKYVFQEGWPKLVLLLFFIQIRDLTRLLRQFQHSLNFSKTTTSFVELFKLIFIIMLVQHIFSCIWVCEAIGSSMNGDTNWITSYDFSNESWHRLYLISLYFTSVTMFTVGYGDITPQNPNEKILCIIFMLVCTIQLSYCVNTVGQILTQLRESNEIINSKLKVINQFMQNKQISYGLQYQYKFILIYHNFRIREYLNYYWRQEMIKETQEQLEIVSQLSAELQDKLMFEANSIVLDRCRFFKNNFSTNFQRRLLNKLHTSTFQPSVEIFCSSKEQDDFFLCIIENGSVDVYQQRDDPQSSGQLKHITTLVTGQYFGFHEFLTSQPDRNLLYKSAGFTSLLVIPQTLFKSILKEYPQDHETFCSLRDHQILIPFQNSIECLTCGQKSHKTEHCKQVHYLPDREKVIKQYQFHSIQPRTKYKRNRYRMMNFFLALTDMELVEEAANVFILQNEIELAEMNFILYENDQSKYESFEHSEIPELFVQPAPQDQQHIPELPSPSNSDCDFQESVSLRINKFNQIIEKDESPTQSLKGNQGNLRPPQVTQSMQESPEALKLKRMTAANANSNKYKTFRLIVDQNQNQNQLERKESVEEQKKKTNRNQNLQQSYQLRTTQRFPSLKFKDNEQIQQSKGNNWREDQVLQIVEKKLKYINQELHMIYYEQLEILRLKLLSNIRVQQDQPIIFDVGFEFKKYLLPNNPSNVIKQYNKNSKTLLNPLISQQLDDHNKDLERIKFTKYMLYPFIFLDHYRGRFDESQSVDYESAMKRQQIMLKSSKYQDRISRRERRISKGKIQPLLF